MKFDEKSKKELSDELSRRLKDNELAVRKKLEQSGVDTSKITILDRAKFLIKYMPDVTEEMFEKYGPSKVFSDEVKKEAIKLAQKRFHDDLAKQPIKSWNIYYILLHCKIYKSISFRGNVTLTPFEGWPCHDYLDMLNRLVNNLGPQASGLSEENLKKGTEHLSKIYSDNNPTSLLVFWDITANTERDALERTNDYVDNVILCMSTLTNTSIEKRVWIIEGKTSEGISVLSPTINFPLYSPTYIEPKAMEEMANKIIEEINNKNYLVELALRCERDALSDDEAKFGILKRWSALEYIAEEYYNSERNSNPDKKILARQDVIEIAEFIKGSLRKKEIEITPALERRVTNYVSQINHKEAKEKVRDLLMWANHPIQKNENPENDIIDIIYQQRNCLVHLGGCWKIDKKIKECDGPAYCKKSIIGQREVNAELSKILMRIIGKFVGIQFEFNPKIPKNIEKT